MARISGNQMAKSHENIIIHPGIVDHLGKDSVFVRILSQSACSTCHAKGACSISESEEKIIETQQTGRHNYKAGDPVTVRMKQSTGQKAVMLGYVIPLVILTASIITLLSIFEDQGVAALVSLLLLVPYYFALYLIRDRLKQHFSFRIYSEN